MSIVDDMVTYRARNRISQAELARRCGISLQTVNSIETGQQSPSRVTLEKIRLVVEAKEEQ